MELVIAPGGQVRCIYDEAIDVTALGDAAISRTSHVEPDDHGRWHADLTPVNGPILCPFALRSEALDVEREWLRGHWLQRP